MQKYNKYSIPPTPTSIFLKPTSKKLLGHNIIKFVS